MADEYLTEVEVDLIANFVENEALVEAVRKVLTNKIYNFGVIKKGKKHQMEVNALLRYTPAWGGVAEQQLTPEQVGKRIMVVSEALAELDRAFSTLLDFKKVKKVPETGNPAV